MPAPVFTGPTNRDTRVIRRYNRRQRRRANRRRASQRGINTVKGVTRGRPTQPIGPPAPGLTRPGPFERPAQVRRAKPKGKPSRRYRRAHRLARNRQAARDTLAALHRAKVEDSPWYDDVAHYMRSGGLIGAALRQIDEASIEGAIDKTPVVGTSGGTLATAPATGGSKALVATSDASKLKAFHGMLKLPVALTAATLEDPKAVGSSSVRTAIESVAGIPQGVKMFVENPGEAVKQIGADYSHRYGPLLAGDTEKFKEQVKSESGLTPFLLEAAAAGVPAGRVAGLLARTRGMAELGAAGRAIHRVASEERPALRFSGGPAGVRPQRKSKNLFVAAGQHTLDARRRRGFERQAERAGFDVTEGGKLRPIEGRAEHGRLDAVRPGAGEVKPMFSLREAAPIRRLTGRVARDMGGAKSRTRVRILQRQAGLERTIKRHVDSLSTHEQQGLKYMLQLGLRGDETAIRELRIHRKRIVVERESEGVSVPEVLQHTNDELGVIDDILAHPDQYLTPKARAVADELRELQREQEAIDPALQSDQARIRKLTPQAEHVGVERQADAAELVMRLGRLERKLDLEPGTLVGSHGHLGDVLPEHRLKAAREIETRAHGRKKKARERFEAARREKAAADEAARRVKQQGDPLGGKGARRRQTPEPMLGVQLVADVRKPFGVGTRRTAAQRAREAEGRVAAAQRELEAARQDVQAARAVRKEIKTRPGRRESSESFEGRVSEKIAAEQRALEAPAYWESTIRPTVRSSLRAAGTGGRAAARDRHYTGRLFRTGREETDPRVFTEGVMRNVKRHFNWALVRRNVDVHAFEWSRGDAGQGITANAALREMDNRAIDPDSVDLIDVRELERRETLQAEVERGEVVNAETGDVTARQVSVAEEVDAPTHEAVKASRISAREVLTLKESNPERFRRLAQNRYVAVPKLVGDELEHATRPGSQVARSLEVVFKSKPSRVLLGFLNVPWLTFQIAANGMVSGLARAINPFDYVQAQRWWRSLDGETQEAIAPYIGIGYHHIADQPHLGAATNRRFVQAWRAFRQTTWMRRLHKANPIDLFFRADQAQNNFFRKAVFYNQAKKAAAERMGRSIKDTSVLQERIVAILKRPPDEQLKAVVNDAELFEQHAAKVNEWLGDYVTYSSAERATLGRAVMFYGYLRYSLRMVFYTMPVGHPVMAAVLGNLGRMGAQEIKRLLGVPANFQVPTSMLASMYFGSESEFNKLMGKTIPIGRMNPFLNAVTQMERPTQVFGIFSPFYQMAMDQLMHQSTFRGKDWKILGQPTPPETERPADYFGSIFGALDPSTPRSRILQRQVLTMFAPYRMAEQGMLEPLGVRGLYGAQGDDSLLWDQRPTTYKDPATKHSIAKQAKRERREAGTAMFRLLAPIAFPTPSSNRQILEREIEKIKAADPKRRRRKRSTTSAGGGFGGGVSSGGGGFGGGTSSGGGF